MTVEIYHLDWTRCPDTLEVLRSPFGNDDEQVAAVPKALGLGLYRLVATCDGSDPEDAYMRSQNGVRNDDPSGSWLFNSGISPTDATLVEATENAERIKAQHRKCQLDLGGSRLTESEITAIKPSVRSSSVGDIFVVNGRTMICATAGMAEVANTTMPETVV